MSWAKRKVQSKPDHGRTQQTPAAPSADELAEWLRGWECEHGKAASPDELLLGATVRHLLSAGLVSSNWIPTDQGWEMGLVIEGSDEEVEKTLDGLLGLIEGVVSLMFGFAAGHIAVMRSSRIDGRLAFVGTERMRQQWNADAGLRAAQRAQWLEIRQLLVRYRRVLNKPQKPN